MNVRLFSSALVDDKSVRIWPPDVGTEMIPSLPAGVNCPATQFRMLLYMVLLQGSLEKSIIAPARIFSTGYATGSDASLNAVSIYLYHVSISTYAVGSIIQVTHSPTQRGQLFRMACGYACSVAQAEAMKVYSRISPRDTDSHSPGQMDRVRYRCRRCHDTYNLRPCRTTSQSG